MTGAPLRAAIIGCGFIGHKRSKSLGPARLAACADVEIERASALARTVPDCSAHNDWREVVQRHDIDVVIVATLHDSLAAIAGGAIEAGKHVLVEKPAGRHSSEILPLMAAAKAKGVRVRVGFNHRYHRAFRKAREIIDSAHGVPSCTCAAGTAMAEGWATTGNGAPIRGDRAAASSSTKGHT